MAVSVCRGWVDEGVGKVRQPPAGVCQMLSCLRQQLALHPRPLRFPTRVPDNLSWYYADSGDRQPDAVADDTRPTSLLCVITAAPTKIQDWCASSSFLRLDFYRLWLDGTSVSPRQYLRFHWGSSTSLRFRWRLSHLSAKNPLFLSVSLWSFFSHNPIVVSCLYSVSICAQPLNNIARFVTLRAYPRI